MNSCRRSLPSAKRIYPVALSIIGVGRIVFGSGYPLISPSRYVIAMKEDGILEENLKAILRLNTRRLLAQRHHNDTI